jgi:hypothetical protein
MGDEQVDIFIVFQRVERDRKGIREKGEKEIKVRKGCKEECKR